MTIFKLYSVDGYRGDEYYCIESVNIIGYFSSREKAESQPEWTQWLKEKERVDNLTAEEYEDEFGQSYEPVYTDIEEIIVQ